MPAATPGTITCTRSRKIRELSAQIRQVQQNTEETYAITNNHFRGQALVNAMEILEELDGTPPAVPPMLADAYPDRFRKITNYG